MTLRQAMQAGTKGQTISRKDNVVGAGTYTMSGKLEINAYGRFLEQGWGVSLKLEDLIAENWELS